MAVVDLMDAVLCPGCDHIHDQDVCPVCTTREGLKLAGILKVLAVTQEKKAA